MRRLLCVGLLTGCTADASFAPDIGIGQQDQLLVVKSTSTISVARGVTSDLTQMASVIENLTPRTFGWVMVSVDELHAEAVRTTGLSIDLAKASGVTFSQVWLDACNPALANFEPCYQFESYQAGEPGFSGTLSLMTINGEVHGVYDVLWEGMSDRYGVPAYFKHGSTGGFAGAYLELE